MMNFLASKIHWQTSLVLIHVEFNRFFHHQLSSICGKFVKAFNHIKSTTISKPTCTLVKHWKITFDSLLDETWIKVLNEWASVTIKVFEHAVGNRWKKDASLIWAKLFNLCGRIWKRISIWVDFYFEIKKYQQVGKNPKKSTLYSRFFELSIFQ